MNEYSKDTCRVGNEAGIDSSRRMWSGHMPKLTIMSSRTAACAWPAKTIAAELESFTNPRLTKGGLHSGVHNDMTSETAAKLLLSGGKALQYAWPDQPEIASILISEMCGAPAYCSCKDQAGNDNCQQKQCLLPETV